MKLSIYTFVRNGVYFDYHVVDMLRHHLQLADEIIVNEGYSTDGTYERIEALDPKVKIHRSHWDRSDPKSMRAKYVTETRKLCSGDWCILLDADEFIPEWEFDRLRAALSNSTRSIIRLKYTHFYGNYRVCQDTSTRVMPPTYNSRIHRNREDIEVWGDASTVRLANGDQDAVDPDVVFDVHHFGEVRHPARLRQKWNEQYLRNMRNRLRWIPAFAFTMMPHEWLDKDLLPYLRIYDGPVMKCVRENPGEFTRDRFKVYEYLKRSGGVNGSRA